MDPYARYTAPNVSSTGAPLSPAQLAGYTGDQALPSAPTNSMLLRMAAPGQAAQVVQLHPSQLGGHPSTAAVTVVPAQTDARAIFNTPAGGVPGRPQGTIPLPLPVTTGQLTFSNYNPSGYGGHSSIMTPMLPVNTTVLLNAGTA
ncbi:hypothetical protein CH063_15118, partial [Colletotrichum higginsianum]